MLSRLVRHLNPERFDCSVISLTGIGLPGYELEVFGRPVSALGMRRSVPDPRGLAHLVQILREQKPDLIQTWMYHADLLGGLSARLAGNIPVLWNVRHANLDPSMNKRTTIATAKTCGALSRWLPARIVCCSRASLRIHAEIGYAVDKMTVIPNGIDVQEFRPQPENRAEVRREFALPPEAPVIGMVARFDPLKDHANFARAAALAVREYPEVRFLLCGHEVSPANDALMRLMAEAGILASCRLLGWRRDIPRVLAALDALCCSSAGEAFPNTVAEAMACGLPCVVTDVGDAAWIVGDAGVVVPVRSPAALAAGMRTLLRQGAEGRSILGQAARRRITGLFSLPAIVAQYEALYREVLA